MRFKKFLPFILIVLLASVIRITYFYHFPGIWVQADTYGYYDIGKNILSGKFLQFFINDERTPIYPIFLNLPAFLSRDIGSPIFSAEFFSVMEKIILIQSLCGILGLILLFKTLRIAGASVNVAFFYTLFTTFNILVFGWERILMAESLSTFWLITLLFTLVKILKKEESRYFIFLFLLYIFGFLLKPFFVLLPVFLFPVLVYFRPTRVSIVGNIIVLLLFYLSVVGYVWRNEIVFNYRGVNKVSELNMLGKILQFNLNIESAKNVTYFYEAVKNYRLKNGDPMPFRFLEKYDFFQKPDKIRDLQRFNSIVIKSNFREYVFKSIMQIPSGVVDMSELYVLKKPDAGMLGSFFYNLSRFYNNLQYANFIIFFCFFPFVYLFLKQRTFIWTFITLIGIITLYQIIFSIFFSYGEFGRLISPALPIIFLFTFYGYWLIFKRIVFYFRKHI